MGEEKVTISETWERKDGGMMLTVTRLDTGEILRRVFYEALKEPVAFFDGPLARTTK